MCREEDWRHAALQGVVIGYVSPVQQPTMSGEACTILGKDDKVQAWPSAVQPGQMQLQGVHYSYARCSTHHANSCSGSDFVQTIEIQPAWMASSIILYDKCVYIQHPSKFSV